MSTGKAILISGPSGVGKSTLIRDILPKFLLLVKPLSYTTRQPRNGEVDGKDYYFVNQEHFLLLKSQGEFLECSEVYGKWYGTSILRYNEAMSSGRYPVKDIDTQGAMSIKRKLGDNAVTIYIKAPSIPELIKRVTQRDGKVDHVRLSAVVKEDQDSAQFDHVLVNDNLKDTLVRLEKIIYDLMQ